VLQQRRAVLLLLSVVVLRLQLRRHDRVQGALHNRPHCQLLIGVQPITEARHCKAALLLLLRLLPLLL
jgi:hypothetical protein